MKDLKTVREALEKSNKAMNDYLNGEHYNKNTGKIDTYFSEPLALCEKALAALDRIEAVETVTVDELRDEHMKHVQCYGDISVFEWQRIRYPNGIRITKEK